MFLKSEEARQYRSGKFLKFFVRFDQILYIFFEKLSASGGLRPQIPWVCPHSYVASAATGSMIFVPTTFRPSDMARVFVWDPLIPGRDLNSILPADT